MNKESDNNNNKIISWSSSFLCVCVVEEVIEFVTERTTDSGSEDNDSTQCLGEKSVSWRWHEKIKIYICD